MKLATDSALVLVFINFLWAVCSSIFHCATIRPLPYNYPIDEIQLTTITLGRSWYLHIMLQIFNTYRAELIWVNLGTHHCYLFCSTLGKSKQWKSFLVNHRICLSIIPDCGFWAWRCHYDDVTIGAMVPQITSLTTVYSTVYSDADHTKHQSSASLAFARGIHRAPVNSPHKWPVTRKMFPFRRSCA